MHVWVQYEMLDLLYALVTSLMTSSCRTTVSTYIGSVRETSLSTFSTVAERPFERRQGVSCVVRDP